MRVCVCACVQLQAGIRRATIANAFVPVFMGSAFKNKGVHALLDGVASYLPCPSDVENVALDLKNDEKPVVLTGAAADNLVGLAFKLEQGKFGQLTYLRIYQGGIGESRGERAAASSAGASVCLCWSEIVPAACALDGLRAPRACACVAEVGDTIHNMADGSKVRVPKLVRMHSNEMEEVPSASAGDIVAMFGVDCRSGTTFTDGKVRNSMTSMFVPDPVVSLALVPKTKNDKNFGKALGRFTKEDPTFRVHTDDESGETIISGMGELHLEVCHLP